jgi:RING finger and CHY zinc finger domain-containing protein 1
MSTEEKPPDPQGVGGGGCEHYSRGCEMECHECKHFFPCRRCHDKEKEFHQDNGHIIDRTLIQQIRCISCQTVQTPSNCCVKCQSVFGEYYCSICNFWENDTSKEHFHCEGCGICRVGGRQNFFHCDTCEACLRIDHKETHTCKEKVLDCDCIICLENLHSSTEKITFLRCGHPIHIDCLQKYCDSNPKPFCALCKKMFLDPKHPNIIEYNSIINKLLEDNPIPEEQQKKCMISCIECEKRSEVDWHPIERQCPIEECKSFNTVILNTSEVH